MPTTIISASGERNLKDGTVDLRVELDSGAVIERLGVTWSKVNTPEKLARWVLDQPTDTRSDATELRRQFAVTYHVEEDGARVVDSVQAAELPEDAHWAALAGGPLGRMTVAQALDLIDRATDWKPIARGLVRVVIPLRDVVERIMGILRRNGQR